MDGTQIVDARLYRNVLVVVVAAGGSYDKYIFRFAKDFSSHDARRLADVATTGIEFTVLDSGVVLHLTDDDKLEVFSNAKDSVNLRVVHDPALVGDLKLFHTGAQALLAKGSKLYGFKMKVLLRIL